MLHWWVSFGLLLTGLILLVSLCAWPLYWHFCETTTSPSSSSENALTKTHSLALPETPLTFSSSSSSIGSPSAAIVYDSATENLTPELVEWDHWTVATPSACDILSPSLYVTGHATDDDYGQVKVWSRTDHKLLRTLTFMYNGTIYQRTGQEIAGPFVYAPFYHPPTQPCTHQPVGGLYQLGPDAQGEPSQVLDFYPDVISKHQAPNLWFENNFLAIRFLEELRVFRVAPWQSRRKPQLTLLYRLPLHDLSIFTWRVTSQPQVSFFLVDHTPQLHWCHTSSLTPELTLQSLPLPYIGRVIQVLVQDPWVCVQGLNSFVLVHLPERRVAQVFTLPDSHLHTRFVDWNQPHQLQFITEQRDTYHLWQWDLVHNQHSHQPFPPHTPRIRFVDWERASFLTHQKTPS